MCARVFAKTLSLYGGKKEHEADIDLLDHYNKKGGPEFGIFW